MRRRSLSGSGTAPRARRAAAATAFETLGHMSATELRGVMIADGDAAPTGSACPPRRSAWAALAATVLLSGGFFAAFPHGLPNYDGFYALAWGSDLLAGWLPGYG